MASEIYIYIKSEDGKEEEYVPSGWKFLSQLKYVLVFDDDGKYFWNINLCSIIFILNLKMAKKKKTFKVAGTILHRKV